MTNWLHEKWAEEAEKRRRSTDVPKWIDFNANQYVRVKLTDYGRKVLRENWVQQRLECPQLPQYKPKDEDDEGWSTWQLWCLMNEFGNHMYNGSENVFELNIQFEAR